MNIQAKVYFGLQDIRNVDLDLPDPLIVTSLQNLANGRVQEIVNFYDMVFSYIIDKLI